VGNSQIFGADEGDNYLQKVRVFARRKVSKKQKIQMGMHPRCFQIVENQQG
jgi:hypothetical protein